MISQRNNTFFNVQYRDDDDWINGKMHFELNEAFDDAARKRAKTGREFRVVKIVYTTTTFEV